MKGLATRIIAASLIGVVITAPSQAEPRSSAATDKSVQGEAPAFAEVVAERLEFQLNRRTLRPGSGSGVVHILFVVNAQGRSEEVRLIEGSGELKLDRAAVRAVRRLNGMVAPARDEGQAILATIVIAEDAREAVLLSQQIQSEPEPQMAAYWTNPGILRITVVPATRS